MTVDLPEKMREKLNEVRGRYPDSRAALLEALRLAQREFGEISDEVIQKIAQEEGLSEATVVDTVSFYSMFETRHVGKHVIRICDSLSCELLGATKLVNYLSEKLGIGLGETTPDGRFTLETVECLAACDRAPVMLINETLHDHLTEEKIDEILGGLE